MPCACASLTKLKQSYFVHIFPAAEDKICHSSRGTLPVLFLNCCVRTSRKIKINKNCPGRRHDYALIWVDILTTYHLSILTPIPIILIFLPWRPSKKVESMKCHIVNHTVEIPNVSPWVCQWQCLVRPPTVTFLHPPGMDPVSSRVLQSWYQCTKYSEKVPTILAHSCCYQAEFSKTIVQMLKIGCLFCAMIFIDRRKKDLGLVDMH